MKTPQGHLFDTTIRALSSTIGVPSVEVRTGDGRPLDMLSMAILQGCMENLRNAPLFVFDEMPEHPGFTQECIPWPEHMPFRSLWIEAERHWLIGICPSPRGNNPFGVVMAVVDDDGETGLCTVNTSTWPLRTDSAVIVVGSDNQPLAPGWACLGMRAYLAGTLTRDGWREPPLVGDTIDSIVRNAEMAECCESARTRVFTCALSALAMIDDPAMFVLEEQPAKDRMLNPPKTKPGHIARSHERPIYTVLAPHAIRDKLGIPTGRHVGAHERRAHWRTYRDPRFSSERRAKRQFIASTWVGPSVAVVGNKRYIVRLDLISHQQDERHGDAPCSRARALGAARPTATR